MSTPTLSNALRFCIACGNASSAEIIKNCFRDTPTSVLLLKTYTSVYDLLNAEPHPDEMDFLATDQAAFEAMENTGKSFPAPLFVFSETIAPYANAARNLVFEYIILPITAGQLDKKLKRIETIRKFVKKERAGKINGKNSSGTSRTFLIKKGKDYQPVNTDSIAAFYSDNKLTFGYDRDGTKFTIQTTLIELESHLSPFSFFRASRQFIINKKFIKRITQSAKGRFIIVLDIASNLELEIGQRNFYRLREWIEEH